MHGYGNFEKARSAIVKIFVDDGKQIGTGSIISVKNDEAIILTARHVLLDESGVLFNDIEIEFFDSPMRFIVPDKNVQEYVKNDIAIITVPDAPHNLPTISLGSTEKFKGRDEVFVISHLIYGTDWNFIMTRVINKYDTDYVVLSYGVIDSGSSGAPVLNKEAEMIAMIRDIKSPGYTSPTVAYALLSDVIIKSIQRYNLGPLKQAGLPLRKKVGWVLLVTGMLSSVGTVFSYHYYKETQGNWVKATTPEESDKYDRQRRTRGWITLTSGVTAVITNIIGSYLLLTEGEPPPAILPPRFGLGYNNTPEYTGAMLRICGLF